MARVSKKVSAAQREAENAQHRIWKPQFTHDCLISMMCFGIRNRWKCRFLTSKSISTTGMI